MRGKIPEEGELRTKTFFALFPIAIDHEWRWLEMVTVQQECIYFLGSPTWQNFMFVDKEKDETH